MDLRISVVNTAMGVNKDNLLFLLFKKKTSETWEIRWKS